MILLHKEPTREILIEAYKNGVSDLIVRPLSSDKILEKVEKALHSSGKMLSEKEELEIDFSTATSPREKIEVVLGNINELLALPFAVIKLIRLCNSTTSTARDFERPVESDPAISAIIMRRATSATHNCSRHGMSLCGPWPM